jgi:hypothetical protein
MTRNLTRAPAPRLTVNRPTGRPVRPARPGTGRRWVERSINKIKQNRAVATRYDKRDFVWRGTVDVAAIRIWLRDPVRT